jgi:hypothetical protein
MDPEVAEGRRVRLVAIILLIFLVAGIAVALAIVIPLLPRALKEAHDRRSVHNVLQMTLGNVDCADVNDNAMPPSAGFFQGKNGTWFFHILPHVEQDNVWRSVPTGGTSKGLAIAVKTFQSPDDESFPEKGACTSYATNSALFRVVDGQPVGLDKFARWPACFGVKGKSNTIILMTRFAVAGGNTHAWGDTSPNATYLDGTTASIEFDVTPDKARNDTAHSLGVKSLLVGLGDGSTRTLDSKMSPETFQWACDPKGKMPPPTDW